MKDDNLIQFVIDVGEYLHVNTPYSTSIFNYSSIDECLDDIRYCLECEVKKNEKKSDV